MTVAPSPSEPLASAHPWDLVTSCAAASGTAVDTRRERERESERAREREREIQTDRQKQRLSLALADNGSGFKGKKKVKPLKAQDIQQLYKKENKSYFLFYRVAVNDSDVKGCNAMQWWNK